MASTIHRSWTVLPHGRIAQLADNLWRVTGSLPGMSLKRVMTIVRRKNGTLVIHSAVALDDAHMRQIDGLGPVEAILVPNPGHRLDAPAFHARYPHAAIYCPSGARDRVQEVVPVTGTYDDFAADETVRVETLRGVYESEGVVVVHSDDGSTLVVADCVAYMDRKRDFFGWCMTTLLDWAPGPKISRMVRYFLAEDQGALREHLEALAAIPDLVRLVVAHEKVALGPYASAVIRKAAASLRKTPARGSVAREGKRVGELEEELA